MRLIMEIPECFYTSIKDVVDKGEFEGQERVSLPLELIANGTPLDDIKAEAEEEQEPKTGHWITGRGTYYGVEIYRCSECKNWFAYKAEKCPNGHVRMVGEKIMYEDNKTDLSTIEDDIGKELKLLRKSKRITQEEMGIYLAKQMGKDKPIIKAQIYSYECGKNRITFPIFIGWCKVCGANPGEVFNKVVKESECE